MAGSFLARVRSFGLTSVTVIHNRGTVSESRDEIECQLQADAAYFEVDAPVFEGDFLEVPDPALPEPVLRFAKRVEVNQTTMAQGMSHRKVTLVAPPSPKVTPSRMTNNTTIVVSGGTNQVSIGNYDVAQIQNLGANAPKDLVELVGTVKALLTALNRLALDEDHRIAVISSAETLLEEARKPEPDRTLIRRLTVFLKNSIAGLAVGASTGAAEGTQEFVAEWTQRLLDHLAGA